MPRRIGPAGLRYEKTFRISAYVPTYPPHHRHFQDYLRARLRVEELFYKTFRGVTTLEGDGLYFEKNKLFIDKTFIIYGYASTDEEAVRSFIRKVVRKLKFYLREEKALLLTYEQVVKALWSSK